MSEIVARTGMPLLAEHVPEHGRVGAPGGRGEAGRLEPLRELRRQRRPAAAMPDRSPLTSARNTGTPMREKCSASTCSVTVLPVPVAPVISPWRLASAGRNSTSSPLRRSWR